MNDHNLRPYNWTGPSPLTLAVLRALLRRPAKVPEIIAATSLPERTVRAQIAALKASEAIRPVARECGWAVYAPVVVEP